MGAPRFCVSSGESCHGTVGGPCYWYVPTATRRAVTSTAGSGTVFQDGRTESCKSVGGAGHVADCAPLPKAVICVRASCFGRSATCRDQTCGFLTCSPHLKRQRRRASVNCPPSVGNDRTCSEFQITSTVPIRLRP